MHRRRSAEREPKQLNNLRKPPQWLGWAVAGASLLAIADMPFGYYQLLRLVVTGYCAYLAVACFRERQEAWGWSFGFLALVYNPIFVITMSKEVHGLVNLATAGFVIYEFRRLRSTEGPQGARPISNQGPIRDLGLTEISGNGLAKSELPKPAVSRTSPERVRANQWPENSVFIIGGIFAVLLIAGAAAYSSLDSQSDALAVPTDSWSEPAVEEASTPNNQPPITAPSYANATADDNSARIEAKAATPSLPSFAQFPAEESDGVFPLEITKGSWFWNFRTRIRDASEAPPNFGSNAVVATWGCGTGCKSGVLVDRSTGSVHEIPVGGEEQQQLAVQTRRGSNLLLASWNRTGGTIASCVFEAFVWTGSEFKSLAGYPKEISGTCPLAEQG